MGWKILCDCKSKECCAQSSSTIFSKHKSIEYQLKFIKNNAIYIQKGVRIGLCLPSSCTQKKIENYFTNICRNLLIILYIYTIYKVKIYFQKS
jgi:hypothetical protein